MANSVHRVKKGETGKKLVLTLRHTDAVTESVTEYPVPVGSAVKLYMTADGEDEFKVDGASMTIQDQDDNPGKVEYQWQSADVDTPGDYDIEIVVTLPDLTKLKWPCEDGETFATVIVLPSKTS